MFVLPVFLDISSGADSNQFLPYFGYSHTNLDKHLLKLEIPVGFGILAQGNRRKIFSSQFHTPTRMPVAKLSGKNRRPNEKDSLHARGAKGRMQGTERAHVSLRMRAAFETES